MKPISSTESKPLVFNPSIGMMSQKAHIPTNKIGWLHSLADQKGASFDITIKDSLGRVKLERKNCSSANEQFGELVNLPTFIGENLEVIVENLKGAKTLQVFLN